MTSLSGEIKNDGAANITVVNMLPTHSKSPDNFFASRQIARNADEEPSAIRPIPPAFEENGMSNLAILPEFSEMKSSGGKSETIHGARAGESRQNAYTRLKFPEAPGVVLFQRGR
ncbi:MAG UNVERIFIED_CONTAM: hypothetical protein LVR18_00430 [Planctomycetaceae bacterium]